MPLRSAWLQTRRGSPDRRHARVDLCGRQPPRSATEPSRGPHNRSQSRVHPIWRHVLSAPLFGCPMPGQRSGPVLIPAHGPVAGVASTTADPTFGRCPARPSCPPGFRTQLHMTTSLNTGGGSASCVQLPWGGCQVVYPGAPELSKPGSDRATALFTRTLTVTPLNPSRCKESAAPCSDDCTPRQPVPSTAPLPGCRHSHPGNPLRSSL